MSNPTTSHTADSTNRRSRNNWSHLVKATASTMVKTTTPIIGILPTKTPMFYLQGKGLHTKIASSLNSLYSKHPSARLARTIVRTIMRSALTATRRERCLCKSILSICMCLLGTLPPRSHYRKTALHIFGLHTYGSLQFIATVLLTGATGPCGSEP